MTFNKLISILSITLSSSLLAGNGTWQSIGDVPSFPDGQPQVTRGAGALTLITGTTSPLSDPRNAFCIKITDPASFVATTDSNTINTANTDFDTRLFLFDPKGQPVLFNDDTPPSTAPFASTLTGTATDGSGYTLTQGGEYILVVAGYADDPVDNIANTLFNQDLDLVHTPIPNSNKFATWENINPATGAYSLALEGVSYCQNQLDIVGISPSLNQETQVCSGDGHGSFTGCLDDSIFSDKNRLTTGYLDDDAYLDVIFDVFLDDVPSICLGKSNGGYESCYVYIIGSTFTETPVLGDINNDDKMDAVFLANSVPHKACLGDGNGSFTGCTDIPHTMITRDGKLALMDGDNKLDLLYSNENGIHVCSGDGLGGFAACTTTVIDTWSFDVADVNHDGMNDLITVGQFSTNKGVCINQGSGPLTCTDIMPQTTALTDMDISDLNNDGHVDVVFSAANTPTLTGLNEVCLGDGNGAFSCNPVSSSSGSFTSVNLGLLNDDNFIDVVFAQVEIGRICMGNGDGTFSACNDDPNLTFIEFELGELGTFAGDDTIFANGFE